MTVEEKLDTLLTYLNEHPYTLIYQIGLAIKDTYLDEGIHLSNRLKSDGMIQVEFGGHPGLGHTNSHYFIVTPLGKEFINDGGYVGRKKKENSMFVYTRRAALWAVIGAVVGLISLAVAILSLLKN